MLTTTPVGLKGILDTFGDIHDPNYEAKNIVLFDLPYPLKYGNITVKRSRCHKLLVDNFVEVFKEIQTAGLVTPWADEYAGIYAIRPIRGFPKFPSCHSWGIAIDLEVRDNPMGHVGKMHPGVVSIFKKYGFTWGGDFVHRIDYMHFQYASGY